MGRGRRSHADLPRAAAGADARERAARGGAAAQEGRAVGQRDVGSADGLAHERLGREHRHDDAAKRVAAFAGRAERQIAREDRCEGEDAHAPVALEPDRRRDAGLAVGARLAQRACQRGRRAEVDDVRRRQSRRAEEQGIREERIAGGRDPDLLGGLEPAPLGRGHTRCPADRDDLGPLERDARVRRERAGLDHVGVVCRLEALQGENRGVRAFLDGACRCPDVGPSVGVGLAAVELPQAEREHDGRRQRGEEGQAESRGHGSARLIGLRAAFLSGRDRSTVGILCIPTEGECAR